MIENRENFPQPREIYLSSVKDEWLNTPQHIPLGWEHWNHRYEFVQQRGSIIYSFAEQSVETFLEMRNNGLPKQVLCTFVEAADTTQKHFVEQSGDINSDFLLQEIPKHEIRDMCANYLLFFLSTGSDSEQVPTLALQYSALQLGKKFQHHYARTVTESGIFEDKLDRVVEDLQVHIDSSTIQSDINTISSTSEPFLVTFVPTGKPIGSSSLYELADMSLFPDTLIHARTPAKTKDDMYSAGVLVSESQLHKQTYIPYAIVIPENYQELFIETETSESPEWAYHRNIISLLRRNPQLPVINTKGDVIPRPSIEALYTSSKAIERYDMSPKTSLRELISKFPQLNFLLNLDAKVMEALTLFQHKEMKMRCDIRLYGDQDPSNFILTNEERILREEVHDIAKGAVEHKIHKEESANVASEILEKWEQAFPGKQIAHKKFIIDTILYDVLGDYMNKKRISENEYYDEEHVFQDIINIMKRSNIPDDRFWETYHEMERGYFTDSIAYTMESNNEDGLRGVRSLDNIFEGRGKIPAFSTTKSNRKFGETYAQCRLVLLTYLQRPERAGKAPSFIKQAA